VKLYFTFAKQTVRVEVQKSKFRGVKQVILINDKFATGGKLVVIY